jgi:hypothetical protein
MLIDIFAWFLVLLLGFVVAALVSISILFFTDI